MCESSADDSPSIRDEPEQVIASAFDSLDAKTIAAQLFHSHSQRLWKTVYRRATGSSRQIQGDEVSRAVELAIFELERWIRKRARRYFSLQWLWMLRRVPQAVFKGVRQTTLGYDVVLAEVLTDDAPQKPGTQCKTGDFVYYRLSGQTVRDLIVHCESTKYLSDLHCVYRWAAKGAKILISPSELPTSEPDEQLWRAVDLYDRRVERFARPFSRLGTIPSDGMHGVLRVGLVDSIELPLSTTALGKALHPDMDKAPAWKLAVRYYPELVRLEDLAKLGLASKVDIASLFVLVTAAVFLNRHRTKVYSVLTRGYLLFEKWVLQEHVRDALGLLPPPMALALKDAGLASAEALLSELSNAEGSAWPPRVGSPLRHEGSGVCLDLFGATSRIDTLEAPAASGSDANFRAEHFELAVQGLLDSSSWRASKGLAELRGRPLRANQQKVTDVDALGERGGCLLAVSCRSIVQRAAYQTGSHNVIRNAAKKVEDAVREWKVKLAALVQTPRGDNFDFSRFKEIVGVVCVPSIIWVPVGPAMELVLPGLAAAVSYSELEDWLGNA